MEKLESLLVEAVNQADTLADEAALIRSVRTAATGVLTLTAIRDALDALLRRVQTMRQQEAEAAAYAERERED